LLSATFIGFLSVKTVVSYCNARLLKEDLLLLKRSSTATYRLMYNAVKTMVTEEIMYKLTELDAWISLRALALENKQDKIIDYFNADSQRFHKMTKKVAGVFVDYSKNKVDDRVLSELFKLARESKLNEKIAKMYAGDILNTSEGRPVLHTALRNRSNTPVVVKGENIMPRINAALDHLQQFTQSVRSAKWLGCTGKPIRNIVNIGIGGSDLGPNMVCAALADYQQANLELFFLSNVDSSHIQQTLAELNPYETLFIISSKTFSTQETILNANSAKKWFLANANVEPVDIAKHFVAVSTNRTAVVEFGINEANIFDFWDWVGGRYSLWSSIGLPIALSIGFDKFVELLEGAHEIDRHFYAADYEDNLPVILAVIGIWNINFLKAKTQAVIPYDQGLQKLPTYLQQLDMESNGKSVDEQGNPVDYDTGPIVWGQTGSHSQHAFFQLLHQGKSYVPIDFIASISQDKATPEHNEAMLTNMLAQAEAFMLGSHAGAQRPHECCPGNKPSNVFLIDEISPKNLGALIAVFEHKVFVQGVIWGINSFDQWGVQLGKELASKMIENPKSIHDSSTAGLLKILRDK